MALKNQLIVTLSAFLLGALFGVVCFLLWNFVNVEEASDKLIEDQQLPSSNQTMTADRVRLNDNLKQSNDSQEKLIAQQQQTISALKNEIAQLTAQFSSRLNETTDGTGEESPELEAKKPPLRKMGMDDFESLTKATFLDKFKGVVLSISGKQLQSLKNGFENSPAPNDKLLAYQNKISDYLLNNNPYSEHYVDDIRCQGDICRLEISTSNEETWNQIYADMTRESWYTSITFEEASELPGQHIYYLPNIAD